MSAPVGTPSRSMMMAMVDAQHVTTTAHGPRMVGRNLRFVYAFSGMESPEDVPGDEEDLLLPDGWTVVALPCEGCGDLVALPVTNDTGAAELWSEGILRVWCESCWPHRQASLN